MKLEDERKILKAGYPGIVPFLMTEEKGKLSFEVYSGIEKEARAFENAFSGKYFSKKALEKISKSIEPYLASIGYTRDEKGTFRYYDRYLLTPNTPVNSALFQESTRRLDKKLLKKINKNLTTFSLDELLSEKLESFVTVIDDTVVAIATLNERLDVGSAPEITVETAPAFRQNGYASACVAALADYLVKKGTSVNYCCRHTHTASGRLAKAVGFEKIGRFYAIAAYKN